MKCPYCGVHYMDDERVCPVCGRRAVFGAQKQEKRADFGVEYQPKAKPARTTARKQTYDNRQKPEEAAWEQAARGAHTHQNPLEPKRHAGFGCLIAILLFLVFFVLVIAAFRVFDRMPLMDEAYDMAEELFTDDAFEETDLPEQMRGTWANDDATFLLTLEDDAVSWETPDGTYTDTEPTLYYINLDADNADEYLTDEELEKYPPDSYSYYYLACWDDEDDAASITLDVIVRSDSEDVYTLVCYDYDTDAYSALTRMYTRTRQYS